MSFLVFLMFPSLKSDKKGCLRHHFRKNWTLSFDMSKGGVRFLGLFERVLVLICLPYVRWAIKISNLGPSKNIATRPKNALRYRETIASSRAWAAEKFPNIWKLISPIFYPSKHPIFHYLIFTHFYRGKRVYKGKGKKVYIVYWYI